MHLTLTREPTDEHDRTFGHLLVTDRTGLLLTVESLEDRVRPPGQKVHGKTAIPAGQYLVRVDMSPRFKRLMPHVYELDGREVRGFSGIRIHAGNTIDDTEGCILVGKERAPAGILHSRAAYDELFALINGAQLVGEEITLTIQ